LATGIILAVSATTLFAQPYSFDENGNGTLGSPLDGGPYPMPFQVTADPTGGITNSPVLIYSLEFPVVSGDLAITQADGTISDLLRFFAPSGAGTSAMVLYSQADPSHTLAGVGIPYSANPVEISPAGPTTSWYPTSTNQPGFPAAPFPVWDSFQYHFITASAPPVSCSGTNLIWTTTGPAYLQFRVVATTNTSLPLTNWTCVFTNEFDQSGHCVLTLPMESDKPCRFYCLSISVP
jgi:hypothetical protein